MFHIMFSFMLLLCSTAYVSCGDEKKYEMECHEKDFEGKEYRYHTWVDHKDIQNLYLYSIEIAASAARHYSLTQKLHNYETTYKKIRERIGDCKVEDIFCVNPVNGESIKIDAPGAVEKVCTGTHQLEAFVSRKNQ